ncbi:DMT family transporter [Gellertiella hungarica]|uniref:Drug/metabolite transporter (DMT)-like permease n=1 Tax=Gellertiella hungarica TaxID=1572859 RepID=A0A7W6J3W1_9HYPH|nr:DMT family transporter [Gellertiella hungarica]MBB4064324.1 drug/metabolite transporter (DMT)-like permease [Gellertiella hungarica]
MDRSTIGWINGFLGVLIFSGSLPATRIAVADFDPTFLTAARAVIAGLIAVPALLLMGGKRPGRRDILPLLVVSLGVVIGFPLLTALALRHVPAAHTIVFVGLLPLATAFFGVLRAGERPQPAFWLFSALGSAAVAGFALAGAGTGFSAANLLMLGAILACGLGYAEGARLSREFGGWQVISWALVLSLPVMILLGVVTLPERLPPLGAVSWAGLAYVSVFSMFVGFVFWYRGLALGGIAGVGQLQLLQPFMGLLLAGWLLGEHVSPSIFAVTAAVVLCVAGARRFSRPPPALVSRKAS